MKELFRLRPRNFFFLFIAGLINAFGVTVFIAPVNLYDSGISGTSIMLSQLTPGSLSLFLLVLNVPLFLFGLRRQGVTFTVYAVFTIAVYAISAWLITDVLPIDVSIASPLAGTDLLLCALFGGLLSGIGSGLAIRFGGAMDGIEVLAVIFAKSLGLTVGTFVMIYNLALYILCGFVLDSWILPLYSIVTYGAALKTVDFVVEGIDRSKAALIVTEAADTLCQALSDAFGCGMTVLPAKGYFSDADKNMVYLILNRFQINRMYAIVRAQDPHAYISIIDVADVVASPQARRGAVDHSAGGASGEAPASRSSS